MTSFSFTRPTAEIRKLIEDSGVSIAEWARENRFSAGLVYQILEGQRKCLRGQSHRIAVALGLKEGSTTDVKALSALLAARGRRDKPQEGGSDM